MGNDFSSAHEKNKTFFRLKKTENKQSLKKSNTLELKIKFRAILVWFIILAGASGLGWRLFQLQIKEGAELERKARQQQVLDLAPYIPRRSIIDSENNVVATDQIEYTLYAHPIILNEDLQIVAQKLAEILVTQTSEQILIKLKEKPTGVIVQKDLNEEQAEKIKQLKYDGLETIARYNRFYPQNELIADIVGYVNNEHHGQAGIEYSQQKLLERDSSMVEVKRTGNGEIIPANLPKGVVEFDDLQLQLTINLRLQRSVREALRKQIQKFNAKRGAVIVMDATDGSILSLVCHPTYNPNSYYDYDLELFKNWTIADAYEPGSTFKPINVAIALEEKVITPDTYVNDPGHVVVDGWNIYNASKKGGGLISITKVLESSSNVGMINIMRRLDKKIFYNYLKELELGKITGVDLPFEAAGYLKDEQKFTRTSIESAVTSFGQGFSLTPLQLVQLHGALANGGKLVRPHVVKGLVDSQGNFHKNLDSGSSSKPKQIFSESITRDVLRMMESVVQKGSGEASKIEGYRIGGKTGTAQKAGKRGGYMAAAKITSFVGILPINSPRYVVLAVIDEPKGGNTFGSTVAAPIVQEVIKSLISIKGIPPTEPIKNKL